MLELEVIPSGAFVRVRPAIAGEAARLSVESSRRLPEARRFHSLDGTSRAERIAAALPGQ